jgi:glycosyltransferase involved in cell wall biosynthesis
MKKKSPLSICIPVYNYPVYPLVHELHLQCTKEKIEYEIILIDDCSLKRIQEINKKIQVPNTKYIQLSKNIGRSKIRNLFLNYVKNDWLLFLDCDSELISDKYINNYLTHDLGDQSVLSGGKTFSSSAPNQENILRWKYGRRREMQKNNESANRFFSNNFFLNKAILNQVRFNEDLKGYGHEDTQFEIDLFAREYSICVINNPTKSVELDTNSVFLEKSIQAAKNFAQIYSLWRKKRPNITPAPYKMWRTYESVKPFKKAIQIILNILSPIFQKLIKWNSHSLLLLDVIKLQAFMIAINKIDLDEKRGQIKTHNT